MKYQALVSKKQFFSFNGSVFRANDGILETEDKDVINFLKGHFAWKSLDEGVKEKEKKERKIK